MRLRQGIVLPAVGYGFDAEPVFLAVKDERNGIFVRVRRNILFEFIKFSLEQNNARSGLVMLIFHAGAGRLNAVPEL